MGRMIIAALLCMILFSIPARGQQAEPNILVIMGDDIGWFNPSCYNHGIMGYRTPNIDRIASEGALHVPVAEIRPFPYKVISNG